MSLNKQPVIEMKRTGFEKMMDIIGLIVFGISLIYLLTQWSSLPDKVPIHYNLAGVPDGWGGKWTIIILPVIGIVMWIGFYFLGKVPHTHNYIGLTQENAKRLYKNSQFTLNILRNECLIFFAGISFETVRTAEGEAMLLGVWALPVFLFVLLGSLACLFMRGLRLR